mmetsp:Transcript_38520/g.90499  ORF Transcript_38520/g.90499 Transcript_38520/m.90499 type:complete len:119 (+) Transcript_38520:1485-1841(+)
MRRRSKIITAAGAKANTKMITTVAVEVAVWASAVRRKALGQCRRIEAILRMGTVASGKAGAFRTQLDSLTPCEAEEAAVLTLSELKVDSTAAQTPSHSGKMVVFLNPRVSRGSGAQHS